MFHAKIAIHNIILLFSGQRVNLFTTAMYNTYSPPPGFCFDVLCSDDPIIDDPDSPDYNIDTKVCININVIVIDIPNDKLNKPDKLMIN